MRVSDTEVKKVLGQHQTVSDTLEVGDQKTRPQDEALVRALVSEVATMPDREEWIAELRAQIENGTYRPTADEIVDTMVRRSIVDNYR